MELVIAEISKAQESTITKICKGLIDKCYVVLFDIMADQDTGTYRVCYHSPEFRSGDATSKQWEVNLAVPEDWANENWAMYKEAKDFMKNISMELMFDHCNSEVILKRYTIASNGECWELDKQ